MWGNFGDLTKKLAEKAAAAAENLEGQLNESVGASDAIADLKKSYSGNSNTLSPTNERDCSEDEDPFNENDNFYGDGSFDVDMHDEGNVNSEEHVEESSALENEKQDEVTNGGQSTSNEMFEEIDAIQDRQPLEETSTENSIQEIHGDIQEEGIYDDEDEDDDDEVHFNGFEKQKDHEDTFTSTGVPMEENPQSRTEIALDIELQTETEITFDDEQENDHISDVIHKEEAENPGPSIVQVNEGSIIRNLSSSPEEMDTVRNNLSKAASKLHNLQNVDDADHDTQIDTIVACAAKEEATLENGEKPNDMMSVIRQAPLEFSSEPVDLSAVKEEAHISISSERGDVVPVTSNENKKAQMEAHVNDMYESDGSESVYVSKEEAQTLNNGENSNSILNLQLQELQNKLVQREDQLASRAAQIADMMELHETEKSSLESKIRETKEEAKHRISKAREKVDDAKAKLANANARADSVGSSSDQQDGVIAALREEGEKLARKQSEMEYLVREARGDMRDLKKELVKERSAKEVAEDKIAELEIDFKDTKTELAAAKQKGGLADKLDSDLLAAKEEKERNASVILGLEAKLKESKSRYKELQKEMGQAFEDKVAELEQQTASIRNEKDSILQDLETKLRTSEREANFREDSLRYEVAELRKRWQEAVRRCDAMSIDLQQSSAPLLRQLESTERQGRARAGAWADLETKLRSEIEEQVIDKEKLQKNKNELEVDMKRATRALQEKESKLVITQSSIDDLRTSLGEVSARYENTISELESLKIEHSNIQKYLKDIESNVRAEFFNTLREDEERFNDQVESLEVELRQERERRTSLEEKIQEMMEAEQKYDGSEMSSVQKSAKSPKRNLGSKANQADILQDTLFGIDPDDDDDDDDDVNSTDLDSEVKDEKMNNGTGSFAFIEQLSQSLKATKSERDTLRKQLDESEERRGVLENEAIASIEVTQALPLLRAQASQLARDANEKDMEIQALQEDINEVRDIYKTQLNTLLGGDASHVTSTQDSIPPSQLVTSEVKTSVKKSVIPSSFNGMRTF